MSNHPTSETQSPDAAETEKTVTGTQDSAICLRSVKTSLWLGLLVFVLCCGSHHTNWAWGFLIGALLSLFSMISLMLAVPFLTWSGAPRHMSLLMIVTLFMKLPIFCLGLYLATHLPGVSAMACCAGICLTPVAITMKAIGNLRNDYSTARQPAPVEEPEPAAETEPEPVTIQVKPRTLRKVSPEFAPEQG